MVAFLSSNPSDDLLILLLGHRCENATERMLEYAATLDPKCKPTAVVKKGREAGAAGPGAKKEQSWRDLPVEKRLEHALIKVCPQDVRKAHIAPRI